MKGILKSSSLWVATLVACGGLAVGCGDDDDGPGDASPDATTEAGTEGGVDASPDATADATPEASTDAAGDADADVDPNQTNIRLAHLVAGGPNIRLCVEVAGTFIGPLPSEGQDVGGIEGIPFRAVTPIYVPFDVIDGVTYNVMAFDVDDIDAAADCAAVSADGGTAALASVAVPAADLTKGGYHTIILRGGPVDAGTGDPVSRCGATGDQACPSPEIVVVDDKKTPDTAGQTAIRVMHAIPNLPMIDVCFFTATGGADGGTDEGTELIGNLAYADAETETYTEIPSKTDGYLAVFVDALGSQVGDCAITGGVPSATAFELFRLELPISDEILPPAIINRATSFPADQTATIFAAGDATQTEDDDPLRPTFAPLLDAVNCSAGTGCL